jgi:two-component system chemotaxis response regulator CheB
MASSAGGLTALSRVLSELPEGFPASVVLVQHLDPRHNSLLAHVLSRRTRLPVRQVIDRERLEPGTVLVAPPDQHVLVGDQGVLSLTHSELVHFLRPSADLMFESLAAAFGERAIAVVLTGTGVDGATGITAVKERGGTVIAQDEATSEFFGMPGAAIRTGCVDFVLRLEEIAPALVTLVMKGRVE